MKLSIRPSAICFALFLLTLVVAGAIGSKVTRPPIEVEMQESAFTFNSKFLELTGLGLKTAIADLMWIQTMIESDHTHYKSRDLDSWMFRRLEAIADLDPYFYENYLYGGQYLMIIKDDLLGADKLLSRGLKIFPSDTQLNWQMGFLWIFELGDTKKGYPYFEVVSKSPTRGPMFDVMYARVKSESFGDEEAYQFALESWKQHRDGTPVKERLGLVLYSLKGARDLQCLNSGKTNCETRDFEGQPYLNEKGVWKSSKPLKSTHLYRRKKRS